jgi:hypothetical protein
MDDSEIVSFVLFTMLMLVIFILSMSHPPPATGRGNTNAPQNGAPTGFQQTTINKSWQVKKKEKATQLSCWLVGKDSVRVDCTICLKITRLKDVVITLDCKHTFHAKCLLDWKQRSTTCPVCRAVMQTNS